MQRILGVDSERLSRPDGLQGQVRGALSTLCLMLHTYNRLPMKRILCFLYADKDLTGGLTIENDQSELHLMQPRTRGRTLFLRSRN